MPTKRDVLQLFTKSKLIEISGILGYKGLSVLTKAELVGKLSKLQSILVDDILSLFKIWSPLHNKHKPTIKPEILT